MQYHLLQDNPPPKLQRQLEHFEKQFLYPLGGDHSFSISHGTHYLDFYLAMGPSMCLVAENEAGVQGTICAAKRRLVDPVVGSEQEVVYVGDLKVARAYRGKRLAFSLMQRLQAIQAEQLSAALCVVMEETAETPSDYTGKAGILSLLPLARFYLLQLESGIDLRCDDSITVATEEEGLELFNRLSRKMYFPPHRVSLRAQGGCTWLIHQDKACVMLENTLRCKRLFLDNGHEIKNAHLSYFAYQSPESALPLLARALQLAKMAHFDGVFLALQENEYELMQPVISQLPLKKVSRAMIFGTPDLQSKSFHINTSEI